jgi:hypothetical protein
LAVHPVADAFLGVVVPPGVTDVTVAFTPRIQIALTWLSNLVFAGAIVALMWKLRRKSDVRSSRDENNPTSPRSKPYAQQMGKLPETR